MSCNSATLLIEKSKVTSLSIKELVTLKMHLAMCPPCSDYKKLSKQLDELLESSSNENSDELLLSPEKKQAILEAVKKT